MWQAGLAGMVVVATAVAAAGEPGDLRAGATRSGAAGVLQVTNATLRDSLDRIYRGSPSWRLALDELAGTGRRAVVVTPDQVVVRDAADRGALEPFDPATLAAISPAVHDGGRVSAVLVVVNLPLLEALHERRGSLPAELHADIDRLLAHEIYGHAVPLLAAGYLSGRCGDPAPGEVAAEACAVRRENIIRSELSLGRRTDAGIHGLLLAFRGRH